MTRKVPTILVLGEEPIGRVIGSVLRVPVFSRDAQDTGWEWPKSPVRDRMKIIVVASGGDGIDRVVRRHSEAWCCPKVSRIAALILVPDEEARGSLLGRDVFGRRGKTDATFADRNDVVDVVSAQASLPHILSCLAKLEYLPVDTWRREGRDASCITPILEAIEHRNMARLVDLLPRAEAVHWDSICYPQGGFSNGHQYANAVGYWFKSVTPGVTPDWERGLALLKPLSKR